MRRLSGFFPLQTTYAELYWYEAQKKNFGA